MAVTPPAPARNTETARNSNARLYNLFGYPNSVEQVFPLNRKKEKVNASNIAHFVKNERKLSAAHFLNALTTILSGLCFQTNVLSAVIPF